MKKLQMTMAVAAMAAGLSMGAEARDTSEQMRDVAAFSQVKLKGSMDVFVEVGPAQSVKVVADSDIIDRLQTDVSGDRLEIGLERDNYRNIKTMKVYITVSALEGVDLYGSGDMMITGAKSGSFDINLKGSGDMTFKDAEFGKLEIDLAGSGDIEMAGSCDSIRVDLAGSGDIDTGRLTCKGAEVSIRGSGDVHVFASDRADVSVTGSGDVVVSGDPANIKSTVRGSGDIIVR